MTAAVTLVDVLSPLVETILEAAVKAAIVQLGADSTAAKIAAILDAEKAAALAQADALAAAKFGAP